LLWHLLTKVFRANYYLRRPRTHMPSTRVPACGARPKSPRGTHTATSVPIGQIVSSRAQGIALFPPY
jgi:hypothetical protein